jgi:glutathione S-transferase
MKLYQAKVVNTCPRRVTIYMAEKGLSCDIVTIDMRAGEGRAPEFLKKNPTGAVPVLEVSDGVFLPESGAIVEYLEELHPDPPMIGTSPLERAQVRATDRMVTDFILRNGLIMVHTDPEVPKRRPGFVQYPEVATAVRELRDNILAALEVRIGDREFLAGDRPTIADCSFFAAVDTSQRLSKYEIPAKYPRLTRWFEAFRRRPSAQYP